MDTTSQTTLFPRLDGGMLPLAPRRLLTPDGAAGTVWRTQENWRAHDGMLAGRPALDRFYSEKFRALSSTPLPNSVADGSDPTAPILHVESIWAPQLNPSTPNNATYYPRATYVTVVITTREIWVNTVNNTWVNCNPTYSTGTLTATNGSASITGAGTTWVASRASGKILIDGAWYTFGATTDTAGTISPVFAGATAAGKAYTARRWFAIDANLQTRMFYQVFNGSLFVATHIGFQGSATLFSGPTVLEVTDLFGTPVTTILTAGFDFTGALDEQAELGGLNGMQLLSDGRVVLFGTRADEASQACVFYSSHLNRAVWTVSPGGFTDVVSKPGSGTALGKLGDVLTLHYADGIVNGYPSGQDDPPLDFKPTLASTGAVAPRTLKVVDGKELYLAKDLSIRAFDGTRDARVSQIVRWADENNASNSADLSFANIDSSFASYCASRNEYIVSVSLASGDTTSFPISMDTLIPQRWSWPCEISAMSEGMVGDPGSLLASPLATPEGQRFKGYCIVAVAQHPVNGGYGLMVLNEQSAEDCLAFNNALVYDARSTTTTTDELPLGEPMVDKTVDRVTLWVSGSSPTSGCFDFNGTTEYASAGTNSVFDFTSGAFTVEFWVNPRSFTGDPVVVNRGTANVDGWYIQIVSSGQVQFVTSQGGVNQQTQSTALSLAVPIHIAVARSGASATIYKNGVASNQVSGTHVNPVSTASPLLFGRYATAANFFSGQMSAIRIWNTQRSASEILNLYQSYLTGHANLVGNWPCTESGMIAHDLSGNRAHAVLQVASDLLVSPGLLAPTGPTIAVTGAITKTFGSSPPALTATTQMVHFTPTPVAREAPQIAITQSGQWPHSRHIRLHQMMVGYQTQGESQTVPR